MSTLRKDGRLVCFRIEKLVSPGWRSGWHTDWIGAISKKLDKDDNYMPSGQCWQDTGIHGFYNIDLAFKTCEMIKKEYPSDQFRVVCLTIEQMTQPVTLRKGGFSPRS